MADENLIENLDKLEQQTAKMAESFRKGGAAADDAAGSTSALGAGASKTAKATKVLGDAALDAGKGLADFAGGLLKNSDNVSGSFKQLNPIIDGASKAVGGLASAVPLVGGALKALTEAAAAGAKLLVDKLESTSNAFREVSKVGGLTADGMTGLRNQFNTAGLSLDSYTKEVTQNSKTLSAFRGTVSSGAEDFSHIVHNLTRSSDNELRRLGKSADDMADITADFLQRETRLGQAQTKSNAALSAGAKEYILQLDELSRLTGLSNKQLADQQEQALSEERFRARVDELRSQGREQEANQLLEYNSMLAKYSPELAQGFRDLSAGFVSSEAAQKAQIASQGLLSKQADALSNGLIDFKSATKELQPVIGGTVEQFQGIAKAGGASGVIGDYAKLSDFAHANLDALDSAVKSQSALKDGNDQLTNSTVSAQQALEGMSISINNKILTPDVLGKAADAINLFSKTALDAIDSFGSGLHSPEKAKELVDAIADYVGGAIKSFFLGLADSATFGAGKWLAGKLGYKGFDQAKKEHGTAYGAGEVAGYLVPGVGAEKLAAGAITKGASGAVGAGRQVAATVAGKAAKYGTAAAAYTATPLFGNKATPAGPQASLDQLIKFTGGTGDRAHFQDLPPESQQRFIDLAQAYYDATGNKLQLNSSFRDTGEQASVNSGSNPKAEPGKSLHQQGRAFDIQSDQVRFLQENGLLSQNGFSPLRGDPPHIQLDQFARGGIANTPSIFGEAGPEAAIPLPDGKSVPVTIDNLFGDFDMKSSHDEQMKLMQTQIDKMDKMIEAVQKTTTVDLLDKQLQHLRDMTDKMTKNNDISQNMLRAIRF